MLLKKLEKNVCPRVKFFESISQLRLPQTGTPLTGTSPDWHFLHIFCAIENLRPPFKLRSSVLRKINENTLRIIRRCPIGILLNSAVFFIYFLKFLKLSLLCTLFALVKRTKCLNESVMIHFVAPSNSSKTC